MHDTRMNSVTTAEPQRGVREPRWLYLMLFVTVAVAAAGLIGLDPTLARAVTRSHALDPLVDLLELITLKDRSEFILPGMLLLGSGKFWASGRSRWARSLSYVGMVPLIAYVVSDLAKPQFGRLRPFEVAQSSLADTWFASGNSFPSGHVAFFAGLTVAIVVLNPRTWALLAVPLVVAAQRVLAADHYISDVATSFGLAAAAAVLLLRIVPKRMFGREDGQSQRGQRRSQQLRGCHRIGWHDGAPAIP